MSSEISITEPLVISSEVVPVAAYQAIYHKLTGKVEKISQTFDDIYCIRSENISQLNRLIEQHILQYGPDGKHCEVTISLRENESLKFNSFEKFRLFNFEGICQPTSVINYQFDFFCRLPTEIKDAQEIVQRYKLVVKLDQDFLEDLPDLPGFIKFPLTGKNINLSIEYTDYAVARAMQGVVREWVSTLDGSKEPLWSKWLKAFRLASIAGLTPVVFAAVLFGAHRAAFHLRLETLNELAVFASWVAFIGFLTLIVARIAFIFFDKFAEKITPVSHLLVTFGDRQRYDTMTKAKSRSVAGITFIIVVVLAGCAVNLFSTWLYSALL